MRSTWKTLVAVAASFVIVPQFAAAETDVEEQLRLMQERMAQMEDRLTAADEQLDAAEQRAEEQAVLLERAGLEESIESSSRISNFLEQTDFSGWVAASYFYNFNNPGTTGTSELTGGAYGPSECIFAEKGTSPRDTKRCVRTATHKYVRNYDEGPLLQLPTDIEAGLTRRDMGDAHLEPVRVSLYIRFACSPATPAQRRARERSPWRQRSCVPPRPPGRRHRVWSPE